MDTGRRTDDMAVLITFDIVPIVAGIPETGTRLGTTDITTRITANITADIMTTGGATLDVPGAISVLLRAREAYYPSHWTS